MLDWLNKTKSKKKIIRFLYKERDVRIFVCNNFFLLHFLKNKNFLRDGVLLDNFYLMSTLILLATLLPQ